MGSEVLSHVISISYNAISQGIVWSVLVLGLFLTFRVLDYADLTIDGSLPLGAAVCATCIASGQSPFVGMLLALIAGLLAGAATGIMHTALKIPSLLSGILSQSALYSVNLFVMNKSNISLYRMDTIFSLAADALGMDKKLAELIVSLIICVAIVLLIWWFLNTEKGFAMRATGNNQRMIRALGVNSASIIVLCLMISNGIVAFGGSLVAQSTQFADVSMGIGSLVVGLAAIIIGEQLFGNKSLLSQLISIVLGSVVYRLVIAYVLELLNNPNWTKAVTSVIVVLALCLPQIKGFFRKVSGSSDSKDLKTN